MNQNAPVPLEPVVNIINTATNTSDTAVNNDMFSALMDSYHIKEK